MGYFAIRREMRSLFWVFLLGCLAGACYFVYKVSERRVEERNADLLGGTLINRTSSQLVLIYRNRETDYVLVYKSLTVFGKLLELHGRLRPS